MPQLLDLAYPKVEDKIVAHEDAEKWQLKDTNKYWLGIKQGKSRPNTNNQNIVANDSEGPKTSKAA